MAWVEQTGSESWRVRYADDLLCLLTHDDARLAKLAGEAFCAITGFDAARAIAPRLPEPEDVPFEEDNLDAPLVPDAIDDLPMLDLDLTRRWWQANRARFHGSGRYLQGRPYDLEAVLTALERGPSRRRHALALGVSIASGGRHSVATRAFSSHQRREMATLRSAPEGAFARMFA